MRRHTLKNLVGALASSVPSREPDAMDLHVWRDGAKVAAWLVGKHRRQIRRTGAVEFRVPKGAFFPNWLRVGLEALRRRGERWEVTRRADKARGDVYWRVRWLAWGSFGRVVSDG